MLPKGSLWISPKLDGELWFLVHAGGEPGAVFAQWPRAAGRGPRLAGAAKLPARPTDAIIAGELVARITEGRARVHHVATALARRRPGREATFHPFDLVEEANADALGKPYAERLARLSDWFATMPAAPWSPPSRADATAAMTHYREWVAAGRHEGLVVRTEQGITYKIKPHFTIDAVIVGLANASRARSSRCASWVLVALSAR